MALFNSLKLIVVEMRNIALRVHSGSICIMYANMIEAVSRRACDCAGYALVGILAGVFVIAIVTNPILP
jgi:hypothetical protein